MAKSKYVDMTSIIQVIGAIYNNPNLLDANDNSYEERICILMKELEEVNKQKQEVQSLFILYFQQSVEIEEAQKQIAAQNQLIQQLKNRVENNDYPPVINLLYHFIQYSRNEYVEMIQSLTEEKETISV